MGKPKAGTLHDSPRFPSVLSSEHLLRAAAISPLHSLAAPVLMPPTQVAVELLKAVVSSGAPLTDVASVVKLFEMIVPLLKDNTDPNAAAEPQEDPNAEPSYPAGDAAAEFEREQLLVARLVHLMSRGYGRALLHLHVVEAPFRTGSAQPTT